MMRVNFSSVVQTARTVSDAVKKQTTKLFQSLAQMESVKNTAASMAKKPGAQATNASARQKVSENLSQISISQPQQKPATQLNQPALKTQISTTAKRPAPQPTVEMRQQAAQRKAEAAVKQLQHQPSGNKLSIPAAPNPIDKMIHQATERLFQEGVKAGKYRMPDVVDGARSPLSMQMMGGGAQSPKLANQHFQYEGETLKLSTTGESLATGLNNALRARLAGKPVAKQPQVLTPRGEQLAQNLRNALYERQQQLDKNDVFPLREKSPGQTDKQLPMDLIEKMVGQLKGTLTAERTPVPEAAVVTKLTINDQSLSKMSVLEKELFMKAREREQRMQQAQIISEA